MLSLQVEKLAVFFIASWLYRVDTNPVIKMA
jgi:hypothetical protein